MYRNDSRTIFDFLIGNKAMRTKEWIKNKNSELVDNEWWGVEDN